MSTRTARAAVRISKIVFWMGVFTFFAYLIFPGSCPCCTPLMLPVLCCFALSLALVPLAWALIFAARWQSRKSETPFPCRREVIRVLAAMALFAGFFCYAWHVGQTGPGAKIACRMEANNSMKHCLLALERYAEENGHYPPHRVTPDADGAPCHSWRVYLLPYLDQAELFAKIRLDEPWDSPWNRQFHTRMPTVYHNPLFRFQKSKVPEGHTSFAVLTGPDTLFPHDGPGREFTPGKLGLDPEQKREEVVILVERKPVCWMDPAGDVAVEQAFGSDGIQTAPDGSLLPDFMVGTSHLSVKNLLREEWLQNSKLTFSEAGSETEPEPSVTPAR